jgi:hypothetical protein
MATAAQVEVVHRLDRPSARLVDLVLTTPVGGRGRVDPVTADHVSDRDLLRVCVAVLARWSRTAPVSPMPTVPRPRRLPWHRSFVVAGRSPEAAEVRAALTRAGRVEGGRRPTVLVVGGALDAMVGAQWRHRVERGAGLRWRRLWSEIAARDALPAPVDLAAVAEGWSSRVPAGDVHVVLGANVDEAVRVAGDLVGVVPTGSGHARLGGVDTDLLRLLNQALATAPQADRLRWVDADLSGHLHRPWTGVPGTPAAQLGWATARAEALADTLASGPWQVHGDPRRVVPSTDAGLARSVPPAETLALALEVLMSLEGGPSWPRR